MDVIPDEAGRQAHLDGAVVGALGERAGELLAEPPTLERVEVLAAQAAST